MGNVKFNIGGGGGVAETLPTVLASCSAASSFEAATVSWVYTNTDYVKGIRVCYKTGGYPENAEDGLYTDIEGAKTLSATITGLTNNVTYYFRLFPYNENGDYQASITNALCKCKPMAISIVAGTAAVETGITEDGTMGYAIISSSGTFDIVAGGEQEITAYLVGGGANGGYGSTGTASDGSSTRPHRSGGSGGYGGYLYQATITTVDGVLTDTASCGAVGYGTYSSLVHNGVTYKNATSNTSRILNRQSGGYGGSMWTDNGNTSVCHTNASDGKTGKFIPGYGYVCSSGGGGSPCSAEPSGSGGTGAGDGAYQKGGDAVNYGCGGGGTGQLSDSYVGKGKQGCIILNWAL